MTLIYLAGPIAHTPLSQMQQWRTYAAQMLREDYYIDTLDPLRGKTDQEILDAQTRKAFSLTTAPTAIFNRDRTDVMRADGLLVNLSYGEVASVGTMFEMAWAHLLQKPIVLVIDKEIAWHRHAFIMQSAGWICTALDDAIDIIGGIFPPLRVT